MRVLADVKELLHAGDDQAGNNILIIFPIETSKSDLGQETAMHS